MICTGAAGSVRAYLGLGANLGDRAAALRRAIGMLPGMTAVSGLYETEPVGGPAGQPAYLNCVAEIHTALRPYELLQLAQELELEAGRVRTVRFGPRTLDIDILLFGDQRIDEPDLQIPHPRMWERGFVMVPLLELVDLRSLPADLLPAWVQAASANAGPEPTGDPAWHLVGEVRRVGRLL